MRSAPYFYDSDQIERRLQRCAPLPRHGTCFSDLAIKALWKLCEVIGMPEALTRLQQEILSYLHRNPHAAETVAGVCLVWLERRPDEPSLSECEQALQGLVQLGFMEAFQLPGDVVIYRKVRHAGGHPA